MRYVPKIAPKGRRESASTGGKKTSRRFIDFGVAKSQSLKPGKKAQEPNKDTDGGYQWPERDWTVNAKKWIRYVQEKPVNINTARESPAA